MNTKTKAKKGRFVPVTPGDTPLVNLERDTEEKAWAALIKDAAHMPYPDKQAFIQRGYTVEDWTGV